MRKFRLGKSRLINTLFYGILSFVSILILYLVIRVFFFDQFPVNTYSMSPTISAGDKIVVNKLIFGARIYKSLDFSPDKPIKSFRIKGFRKVRHNDVIVFNFPLDKNWNEVRFKINYVYTKRCVGLPGDSISVVNGFYINSNFDDTLGYYPNQILLSKTPVENLPVSVFRTFPLNSKSFNWNIKNFGPLYVPKSGDQIILNSNNYILYKIPVEYETNQGLNVANDSLFLGTKFIDHYTFQKSYYFVVGDNVMNSADSRYFGFVPEEFIVGVVGYVKKRDIDR
ncbi:MAG: signal peptidase I [Rikenellaceae bacterium]